MTTGRLDLSPLLTMSTAIAGLVAKAAPSVVSLQSGRSRWSGLVWRPGFIITADDALPEEGEIGAKVAGGETAATTLVGRDATTDIALLRFDHAKPAAVPLTPVQVATGALAMAIGAEEGQSTAALGVVSFAAGPWRSLRGGEIDQRIELDVRLRRSAEGGLAIDAAGQALGMMVFGPRRRVLIIPCATLERVAAKLESHGRIARGYLGLGLQPVTLEGREGSGAMIMSIDPQGPGATAGLHQGDILIAWNGEPIRHVQALLRALGPDSVGQKVTLGLSRAGEMRQVPLTIAERPAA